MASQQNLALNLPAFRNEPYTDFTHPENRKRMEEAQAKVRGATGPRIRFAASAANGSRTDATS